MPQLSVVIITKNEAHNIIDCVRSAKKISKDIVIVDSGSTDETVSLATREGARVESIHWRGYGHARNRGANLALNEWIVSLDADERITSELAAEILALKLSQSNKIYSFKRKNFYGDMAMKYGALGHDRVYRIYHRNYTYWNLVPVHEQLENKNLQRLKLQSPVLHYGIRTLDHYYKKRMGYAFLCALKYKQEGKKFVAVLCVLSPVFNFIKSYLFQLGFLDKRPGFMVAKINAQYTAKKYLELYSMLQEEKKQTYSAGFLKTSLRWINSFLS